MTNTNRNEIHNTKPSAIRGDFELTLHFATKRDLADLCEALAEGEHHFGIEATRAGNSLVMWPDALCPWFVAGPHCAGYAVEDFAIVECV